jgi:hypothetical protein
MMKVFEYFRSGIAVLTASTLVLPPGLWAGAQTSPQPKPAAKNPAPASKPPSQALAPETEVWGGIIIHPTRYEE